MDKIPEIHSCVVVRLRVKEKVFIAVPYAHAQMRGIIPPVAKRGWNHRDCPLKKKNSIIHFSQCPKMTLFKCPSPLVAVVILSDRGESQVMLL